MDQSIGGDVGGSAWDVVVLGAGAAGLFCAATAAQMGARVVVLEHNTKPGKKIRISGGGRCNFTNVGTTHLNFLGANPDFARSALARYKPQDFIDLVDKYEIPWHEKTLGQLFCDGSAQQIIDMLMQECQRYGAEVRLATTVKSIEQSDQPTNGFDIDTNVGVLSSTAVIVATGGLSIPPLGATGLGYDIARQFGHHIIEPEPALVPLTFDTHWQQQWSDLAGVSVHVEARADGPAFRENLLFTHKGLSGPAILQASSYWRRGEPLTIDLIPEVSAETWYGEIRDDQRILRNVLTTHLPSRLLQVWPDDRLNSKPGDLRREHVADLIDSLHAWELHPSGTEGFNKAEVTRGGVDTAELSSKTMESKRVPGLYFIGEVVDITGWLGGYNFQWAWSSGYAAGVAAAER